MEDFKSGGLSFRGVSETSFEGIGKRDSDRELYRARKTERRSKSAQWAHEPLDRGTSRHERGEL